MRDSRLLVDGTSALALPSEAGQTWTRVPLKAVENDVYGKLARRRRKAQMTARRALGVHDDVVGGAPAAAGGKMP